MTSEPAPLRLFVALDLPAEHRRSLGRRLERLRSDLPPARWVRPESLHLTLAFLGDTGPERVPGLAAALHPAFAAVPRFVSALGGAGTFPPRRPARVAWIGWREVGEAVRLGSLQSGVAESAARCLGTEPEGRRFHAHVTVARPKKPWGREACEAFVEGALDIRAAEPFPSEPFEVTEGVLYRSELGPGGARYAAVERFPLGAAS